MRRLLRFFAPLSAPFFLFSFHQGALADTIYLGAGFNGINLGYSRAFTENIAGRVDLALFPKTDWKASVNTSNSFVNTLYSYRSTQLGLLVDWYVASQLRLVGGVVANDMQLSGAAQAGSSGAVNGRTVTIGANDIYRFTYKLPSASPYLGVGWGGKPNMEKGWGFRADLGLAFGKGKVTLETNLVGAKGLSQADLDAELLKARDKQSAYWPTALAGAYYRF